MTTGAGLLLLATACQGEPAPAQAPASADAGTDATPGSDAAPAPDAGGPTGLPEPDPPAPVAAPRLEDWPCPEGWEPRRVDEDAAWSYCEPPPAGACEGATAWSPACGCCRWVGSACPEGEERFPEEAELLRRAPGFDGAVLYVDPRAAPGGDGSRGAPFRTVVQALARPRNDVLLALARGVHAGPLALRTSAAVVGACARETRLELPPGGDALGAVDVTTTGRVTLADLTVAGDRWGIGLGPGSEPALLRGVVVEGGWGFGIAVADRPAGVELADCVVRDVRAPEGESSSGIVVMGTPVRLDRVVVEAVEGAALFATRLEDGAPGTVDVRDLTVVGTRRAQAGYGGGILLEDGTSGVLERVVLDGSAGPGLVVSNRDLPDPVRVEVRDLAILRPGPKTDAGGTGVSAAGAVDLSVHRLLGDGLLGIGVYAHQQRGDGVRAEVEVTDAVLLGRPDGGGGDSGVTVRNARIELRRVVLHSPSGAGLVVGMSPGPGGRSELAAEDLVVRGGVPVRNRVPLPGMPSEELVVPQFAGVMVVGAALALRRAVLADVPVAGVTVIGDGRRASDVTLDDVTVRGVRAEALGIPEGLPPDLAVPTRIGFGILVAGDVILTASRLQVAGQEGSGLLVTGQGDDAPGVVLEDVRFGTPSTAPGAWAASTLVAGGGARLRVTRGELLDGRGSAVMAMGQEDGRQTSVELSHVDVLGTVPASCDELPEGEPGSCIYEGRSHAGGIGVLGRDGALVGLSDFRVRGSVLAGVVVAHDAVVEGHRGVVTDNAIGINLMVPGYDVDRISDEVYVFGNGTDIAQEQLPLPDPAQAMLAP